MASILSKEGKSIQPQAFKLNSIILKNFTGDEVDIRNLLSKIKIRTSLFLPTMILEITLRDAINFFETYQLSGQERIIIDFEKTSIYGKEKDKQIFQAEFYITEYSSYVKSPTNASVQAYTMKGIAPYAYNSKFIKISRSYSNNSTQEIKKILENDLFYNKVRIAGTDATTHSGVINIQEPMAAIEYLRKAAFDEKGAPFFFYQTLDGSATIASLSFLNDKEKNKKINDYVFLKGYKATPLTPEDYVERATRILSTTSNLELSKAFQASDGAFASNNFILDIKSKTYQNKIFDYSAEKNINLRKNTVKGDNEDRIVFSQNFKLGRDEKSPINTLPEAHQEFIATNTGAFSNNPSYNSDMAENIEALNSYMALMNSVSQTIKLNGDFNFDPGRKIGLIYPRTIEAEAYKQIVPKNHQIENLDKMMTGTYMIVSAIHTFEFGELTGDTHFTDLEVRKDSLF